MHEKLGNDRGPAFIDKYGNRMTSKQMQPIILNALLRVQSNKPHIISSTVEVLEEYGISRSFRRGATTHAKNQGVKNQTSWRQIDGGTRKMHKVGTLINQ